MNQFMVPQFIDVEDKIFGPITARQFVIMLAGGFLGFLEYKFADTALFITLAVITGIIVALFAFFKPNGLGFHFFLLNILQTARLPSRRTWNKYMTEKELRALMKENEPEKIEVKEMSNKNASHNRIRDLSLLVNTGGYYKGE